MEKKRPHRLSSLTIDPKENKYVLGGGTWGSGEIGSDEVFINSCVFESKNKYYAIETPYIPIRMDMNFSPFSNEYFKSQSAKAWAVHEIEIISDTELTINNLAPMIHSIDLQGGPHHHQIGVTINGLDMEILYNDRTLPNGKTAQGIRISKNKKEAKFNLYFEMGFGPELTRPTIWPNKAKS